MDILDFIAIDFETANSFRGSACAIGLAFVKNNQIVSRKYHYIKPKDMHFDPYYVKLHGISERNVKHCPEWPDVWDSIANELQDHLILAHNASFDMSVLRHVFDDYKMEYPIFDFHCTRVIGKKVWPGLINYTHNTLARLINIKLEHPNAHDNAATCAKIALKALETKKEPSLRNFLEKHQMPLGKIRPGKYRPAREKKPAHLQAYNMAEEYQNFNNVLDEDHPFYNKHIAFTGTLLSLPPEEAMRQVLKAGGHPETTITNNTNFFVYGKQDFSNFSYDSYNTEMKKAIILNDKGHDIEILSEEDFLQLL